MPYYYQSPGGSAAGEAPLKIKEYLDEGVRFDEAIKVGKVIFDTFNQVSSERSIGGLEASRWACENHIYSLAQPVLEQGKKKQQKAEKTKQASPKTKTRNRTRPKTASSKAVMEKKADSSASVNIDDTDAFMNAFQKLRGKGSQATKAAPPTDANCRETIDRGLPPKMQLYGVDDTKRVPTEEPETPAVKEDEENRENMVHFKNWGTPVERPASTSAPRRVILTHIPAFLRGTSRLLALVHGGRVESVVMHTATQSAEIRFCDVAACKAFYDKYPNGIDVDYNGSRGTVFVEIGKEADIVSSRLLENLDLGATRVVRAIGAPLDVSIAQLVELIDAKKWQLEKINDTYEASTKIRTVIFRFCSMDAAVRFRSYLIRMDNWDQANVQFGPDPCEVASGIHWD